MLRGLCQRSEPPCRQHGSSFIVNCPSPVEPQLAPEEGVGRHQEVEDAKGQTGGLGHGRIAILEAAAEALTQSGATLAATAATEVAVVYEDTRADVVVVGGGIAGMTAAMVASDAGLNVILLEKGGVLGGAATTSHSSVWAVGSELTKDKYDFTADEIYEFFNKQAGPVYNKDVFYALANESYNTLHFLMDNGVVFEEVSQCNPQAEADPRFWRSASVDFGAGLIASLTKTYFERPIDTRMETAAVALQQDETGAVTGVTAECAGQQDTIFADKVILATGGIGQNPRSVCARL